MLGHEGEQRSLSLPELGGDDSVWQSVESRAEDLRVRFVLQLVEEPRVTFRGYVVEAIQDLECEQPVFFCGPGCRHLDRDPLRFRVRERPQEGGHVVVGGRFETRENELEGFGILD